jgi:hypothetical protein
LASAQRHRGLDVRGDHAFFDQAVRIVAGDRVEALDLAVIADARLDFAAAKIQRAARVARDFQRAVDGVERLQRFAHRGVIAASRPRLGFCR